MERGGKGASGLEAVGRENERHVGKITAVGRSGGRVGRTLLPHPERSEGPSRQSEKGPSSLRSSG
jgi:hypothetical protein